MKRPLAISLLTLAVLALLLGYSTLSLLITDRFSKGSKADGEIAVRVVRVKKSQVQRVIQLGGELEPLKEMDIVSRLPGVVKEIRYNPGDRVAAGTVVAILESKALIERLHNQAEALKEAQGNLRAKEAELVRAEKELATARQLHERELIARREVEQAEATVNTVHADKDVAQAQLTQHESMLEQTRYLLNLAQVVAPSAGVVTRRWIDAPAPVEASTKILSIGNSDTMRVVVRLPAWDAADLHPGMTLRVRIDELPGREVEGKLARIDVSAEAAKTAVAEIHVANPSGLLKTRMKAVVSLPTRVAEEAILIPQEAVFGLGDRSFLYTVAAGKARQKPVTKGFEHNGQVVITAGLAEGESVIVRGVDRLQPESRVRVVK
jgi:membrane fusion protein (multidrug efflux system)